MRTRCRIDRGAEQNVVHVPVHLSPVAIMILIRIVIIPNGSDVVVILIVLRFAPVSMSIQSQ